MTNYCRRHAILGETGTDIEIKVPPGVSVRTDRGQVIGMQV